MLGYVRAYKPELKFKEYDVYKGLYCTLCKTLMKRYSPLAQLFLSYDAVFFGLLLLSVSDECVSFKKSRCCYNPVKKCMSCGTDGRFIRFCADISVLMFYYKLKDNLSDKGFFSKLVAMLFYPAAGLMHKKAKKLQPQAEMIIKTAMDAQSEIEKGDASLDAAADPSAKALSELAQLYTGLDAESDFCKIAYLVGRFVYCIDCVDDVEKDIKNKNFNPVKGKYLTDREGFYSYALGILNLNMAEIMNRYDRVDFKKYSDILFNILFDGIYNSSLLVLKKYREKEEVGE